MIKELSPGSGLIDYSSGALGMETYVLAWTLMVGYIDELDCDESIRVRNMIAATTPSRPITTTPTRRTSSTLQVCNFRNHLPSNPLLVTPVP
jgi:hypothetical protein